MAEREHSDPVFCRSKREFSACHQIEDFRSVPGLDDDGANAGTRERLRGGAQCCGRGGHSDNHQTGGIKAESRQTSAEKVATFHCSEILLYPKQPFPVGDDTGRKREGKAAGRRCITGVGRKDFMQSAASETAAKAGIRCRMTNSADLALSGRVSLDQTAAQSRRQFVPVLHGYKRKCSLFVPVSPASEPGVKRA